MVEPAPRSSLRPWHWVAGGAFFAVASGAVLLLPGHADPIQDPFALGLSSLLFAAWGVAAFRVSRARDGWERRAWSWFAAAGLAVIAGLGAYAASLALGGPAAPAWLPLVLLAVYALALVGLLQLARRQTGPRQTTRLLLDAAIMAGAFFFVLWSAVYRDIPHDPATPAAGRALLMAYPVLDAALATVALQSLATPPAGRPPGYRIFLAGIALAPLVDAVGAYAALTAHRPAAQAGAIGGLASTLLLLLGTLAIRRGPAWTAQPPAAQPLWVELLPLAPMALAIATAVEAQREHGTLAPLQFWVAILVIALFLARLALTLVQNHRLRAALEETAAAKTQLLRFVSHEMANPLSPLGIELHLARTGDPATHAHAWQIIDRSVGRLNTLSRDLRDMALAESGRIVQDTAALPLASQVAAACQSLAPLAAARGVTVACDPGPAGLHVRIDRERFGQVLDNLLSNALKFTPDGGAITVTAGSAAGNAEVRVRDTGVGLTPEQAGKLFGAFSRPHANAPGLGLGLYLSRSIMAAMGGSLDARSDGPGKGSTFTLRVPLAAGATAEPVTPR